jgi:hypothetical protein
MPCDTRLKPRQTIQQRAAEVRQVVDRLKSGLTSGTVKVKVGPTGAVTFTGLTEGERDGVTDAGHADPSHVPILPCLEPSRSEARQRRQTARGMRQLQSPLAVSDHESRPTATGER